VGRYVKVGTKRREKKCTPCGMEGLELRLIHLDGSKTKKWGLCVSGANSS